VSANVTRPTSARARMRRLAPALAAPLLTLVLGALPQTASADVKVTSVFAEPVDATPTADNATNQRYLCKPERRGKYEYDTYIPFDIGVGDQLRTGYPAGLDYPASAGYTAPNVPSADDLTPALQAGQSADLCFGFTMTPNMQPDMVMGPANAAGRRLNDPANPIADDPDTHIYEKSGSVKTPVAGDDLRDVTIDMPTGFAGDPDSHPQCTAAQFGLGDYASVPTDCDAAVLGTVYANIWVGVMTGTNSTTPLGSQIRNGGQVSPQGGLTTPGLVYNLDHGPNELARLGVAIQPALGFAPAKFSINLALSPDGRIRTIVRDAPTVAYGLGGGSNPSNIDPVTHQPKPDAVPSQFYLEALGVRVWGKAADHPNATYTWGGASGRVSGLTSDFAQWGTQCGTDFSAKATITTYKGVSSAASSNPFKLSGCDQLQFAPSIDVSTTENRPGVPTGATIRVSIPQGAPGDELHKGMLKDASVTLPKGLELGGQVASGDGGLKLCSAAQFAKDSTNPNTCPADSAAGDVTIKTPLLARDFVGKVYLGEQPAVGELPKLYIQAQPSGATADDAPRIKLVGDVKANDDGSITTSFKDAPQLRFSEIQLDFPKGDHALFVTPRACGKASSSSTLTAWSGQTVNVNTEINISQCDAPAFAPTISMVADDPTVGASSPTTITISRPDRSPWLKDVKVSLPTGFLSDLNAASECSKAAAAAASCPDSSRIGSVTTVAGAGEKPLSLTGAMYLVERDQGSVAGAAIVVRAKLGELDLGDVVVPAKIDLRPTDAGLVLTTTAPTRFKNLALMIRTITVRLDRSGFPLNPTACGPLRATADLGADTGETASPTADVTFTGCAARPFQPQIKATLEGVLKPGVSPAMHVSISTRKGDSNLKSTTMLLPDGLSTITANINGHRCDLAAFNGGSCPATTRVGSVGATVAITSDKLSGDVFLVNTGERLPGIGMSFGGRYTQRVLSRVKVDGKTGRLLAIFDAIPDLPLTTLDLTIDGGSASPLQLSPDACKTASSWDVDFGGQGGQSSKVSIPFDCSAPTPTTLAAWSRKSGVWVTVSAPSGRTIQSARFTLPKGFKIVKSKASVKRNVKITALGGKVTSRITSRTVTLKAVGTKGPAKIKLLIKPAGYKVPASMKKGLKKGAKLNVATSVVLFGGASSSNTLSAKVK